MIKIFKWNITAEEQIAGIFTKPMGVANYGLQTRKFAKIPEKLVYEAYLQILLPCDACLDEQTRCPDCFKVL
jgi:hypothetical protein